MEWQLIGGVRQRRPRVDNSGSSTENGPRVLVNDKVCVICVLFQQDDFSGVRNNCFLQLQAVPRGYSQLGLGGLCVSIFPLHWAIVSEGSRGWWFT